MGIKLSQEQTPTTAQRLQAGFVVALGGLISGIRRILLPHLLFSLFLFLLLSYAGYKTWMTQTHIPLMLRYISLWLWIGLAGLLMSAYTALVSVLYGLKIAATYAEDFFYALFEELKNKIRAHINKLDNEVAKQQATVLLENSMREVLSPLKSLRMGSVSTVLGQILLALLTFISRWVFTARIVRTAGTTVRFSSVFASRATLIGALFLNMRWLATLCVWICYAGGLLLLLCGVWLVW